MEFVYKVWVEVFEEIGKVKYLMLVDLVGKLVCMFDVLDEEVG